MQRRQFLRATVATVTGWTIGCGDDGGDGQTRKVEDAPELYPQSVASGDPRAESVILWTRVAIPDMDDADIELSVDVYLDEALTELAELDGDASVVVARAQHDHCVKVRLAGLAPATVYWYRFVAKVDDRYLGSQVGRTKTAPAADADTTVRFAFVSCQDFGARYYNGYAHLARRDDLDFFVHLGDYIYETAGDTSYQEEGPPDREVVFEDADGVLGIDPDGDGGYQAARSIDNYRQLYRLYRSDSALQRAHERLPMIVTWDDHEFSNDCWGANGTYLAGRADEHDPERRQNANQAWFEYMPVDYADPEFEYDRGVAPPDDIRIWRDFVFGKHVHLAVTDLRSYRSDHVVPEDAYPGTVVVTEADLDGDTTDAAPYVEDIDTEDGGSYAELLRSVAMAAGYPAERIEGPISVAWINDVIADEGSDLAPIDPTGRPLGIAYVDLLKGSLFSSIGSRALVASGPFAKYAAKRWADTDGASETAMGAAQESWFLDTMRGSNATWKLWANEFCLSPLQIDLSALQVPASFQRVFNITVDDWNGMPNRRDVLLDELADVGNVVALTGDIHAFFAATPTVAGAPDRKIVELVGGSMSSLAFQPLLQGQVEDDPVLSSVPGATDLAGAIRDLLLQLGPNPHLAFADVTSHGYGVIEAGPDALFATYYMHAESEVHVNHYEDTNLDSLFVSVRFRVDNGSPELFQQIGGEWMRWDPTTRSFV